MDVTVYVGDSKGNVNPSGTYAWFNVFNISLGLGETISTNFGTGFGFTGNSAEWIMERPYETASSGPGELANYNTCEMTGAVVLTATGSASVTYSSVQNQQWSMYEKYVPQSDDNVLSTVSAVSGQASTMLFSWQSFH
jgi:hypothetical protein